MNSYLIHRTRKAITKASIYLGSNLAEKKYKISKRNCNFAKTQSLFRTCPIEQEGNTLSFQTKDFPNVP